MVDEVKKVVEEFVRNNPRLEFVDSASFADEEEAARLPQLVDARAAHQRPEREEVHVDAAGGVILRHAVLVQ